MHLLESANPDIQMFAATTLNQKTRHETEQLGEDVRQALLNGIVAVIARLGPSRIRVCLCAASAHLLIGTPGFPTRDS